MTRSTRRARARGHRAGQLFASPCTRLLEGHALSASRPDQGDARTPPACSAPPSEPPTAREPSGAVAIGKSHREQVLAARRLGATFSIRRCAPSRPHSSPRGACERRCRVEISQLDPQQRCLQPVETLVEAQLDVLAPAALTEVGQPPRRRASSASSVQIARRHRSPRVLARLEAEGRCRAQRPARRPRGSRRAPAPRLEHEQAGAPRQRADRVHVAELP